MDPNAQSHLTLKLGLAILWHYWDKRTVPMSHSNKLKNT